MADFACESVGIRADRLVQHGVTVPKTTELLNQHECRVTGRVRGEVSQPDEFVERMLLDPN